MKQNHRTDASTITTLIADNIDDDYYNTDGNNHKNTVSDYKKIDNCIIHRYFSITSYEIGSLFFPTSFTLFWT